MEVGHALSNVTPTLPGTGHGSTGVSQMHHRVPPAGYKSLVPEMVSPGLIPTV